jgi:glucose/arabinose dehydrogenase
MEALRNLPTRARPRIDPSDVWLPEGYAIEPVVAGLSFPTDLCFGEDGSIYIGAGGSTWATRPAPPPRILWLDPSGEMEEFAREIMPGPRGLTIHDGGLYVSVKGGYYSQIHRIDLETRERTVIIDTMPDGGWHEPGGPVFGPDGLMYFSQGSVSLRGVVLPAGFTVDVAKHPFARDVPGQDVTLTGNNVWSRDPRSPFPFYVATGPFKPYGVPAEKGEVIEGQLWCNTGVWRSQPDGSDPELLAWGLRNPIGLAIDERGELFACDNDFEEKTERAIAEDPDVVWHIRNAAKPYGSVAVPDWYGFPDICHDGLPAWHDKHLPNRGQPAEPLIENPPEWAGPAAWEEEPHSCMVKMDFSRSDAFGFRGELFVCEWGTMAPFNTNRPEALERGFKIVRVDTATGTSETFLRNRQPGAASYHPGSGGIERPVSCRFSPDGSELWVLDFGVAHVNENAMVVYGHTGALWRVTRAR